MKTNSSRYLFLSLISLLTIGALAKESKPAANKSWDPSPTGVLAFLNTFDSVGDLLNGLAQMNLIQEHEKTAVLEVLKAKRIPVATKLVQGRVDGKRIHWGKKTLTIEGNGVFKTSDGTLIKVGNHSSFDTAFSETLRLISNEKYTSLFGFLITSAYAGYGDSLYDAMSGAYYVGSYHAFKATITASSLVGTGLFSGIGFPLEWVTVGLRNLQYKDSVECLQSGGYKVNGGFKTMDWRKEFNSVKRDNELLSNQESNRLEEKLKSPDSDSSIYGFSGYSDTLMGYFTVGVELLMSAYSPKKAPDAPISMDLLKQVWKNGQVPKCTMENAGRVSFFLRAEAGKSLNIYKRMANPPARGKDPNANSQTR